MPWVVSDVESKIKGLSPIQKKKWVEVANNALKSCIAKGGTDQSCAPQAITAANAAAKNFSAAAFLDGPLVNIRGMEIFRTGKWNGREFKEDDLKRMADNFAKLKSQLIPKLKITHREKQETLAGLASFGDIVNITAKESNGSLRLYADVDSVPKKVAEWIRDKRFAERSIELMFGFKNGDKTYKDVIKAVALLGHEIPAVAGMKPIKLSKEDNLLDTEELVGISYTLDEDVSFTMEEIKTGTPGEEGGDTMDLKEILGKIASLQTTIDGIVKMQKDAAEKFAKEQDTEAKAIVQKELDKYKKDLEGVTEMKKDYEKMKTSLEEAKTKNDELQLEAKTSRVDSFVKDLKTSGKLLPAFEAEAKALLMQISEEEKLGKFSKVGEDGKATETELSQFEALQNLLTKLPKLADFKEVSPANRGGGGGDVEDGMTVGEDTFQLDDVELEKEVKKYMKENDKVSYEDAVVEVSARFKKEGKEQGLSEGE